MGRAKLKMELIPKEKTRNTTYQKRKLGLMKKANEFSILCAVDTVIIFYPPNSNEPEIWPQNEYDHMKKSIAYYKSKKAEGAIRSYNLKDFFEERKKKIEDELVKTRKKNLEAKYATWFDELNGLNEVQLTQFAMALEKKENLVRTRLEHMKLRNMNIQLPPTYNLMPGQDNKHPGMMHYQGQSMMHYQGKGMMHYQGTGMGMMHYPGTGMGLDQQVNIYNRQNNYGWFNNNATTSSMNQWAVQQQMVRGNLNNDYVKQEPEGRVNKGKAVMNHYQGRLG